MKGNSNKEFVTLYSLHGIYEHMLRYSVHKKLPFVAEMHAGAANGKMDHLACFFPGLIALTVMELRAAGMPLFHENDYELAQQLVKTCYMTYEQTTTGISPEISFFNMDNLSQPRDFTVQAAHYLLRPETVESLFLVYRMTGDPQYQEMGWKIFEAIKKHCKTPNGAYSGINDVNAEKPVQNDVMESFFLAETLKYLYLLFAPNDLVPLHDYIFTTEGHVFRKIKQ